MDAWVGERMARTTSSRGAVESCPVSFARSRFITSAENAFMVSAFCMQGGSDPREQLPPLASRTA